MTTNKNQKRIKREGYPLLDMLSEKSLEALKGFGHIYKDPNTGRTRMRPYRKRRPIKNK